MKTILLFVSVIPLLATMGCLVSDRGGHGGRGWHDHGRGEVFVAPRAVEVRTPEVIIR